MYTLHIVKLFLLIQTKNLPKTTIFGRQLRDKFTLQPTACSNKHLSFQPKLGAFSYPKRAPRDAYRGLLIKFMPSYYLIL
jgi:hypothetical protein